MKFCKDCKYSKPFESVTKLNWGLATCHRPGFDLEVNLVDGTPIPHYCNVERMDLSDSCGLEGKFFESKELDNSASQ